MKFEDELRTREATVQGNGLFPDSDRWTREYVEVSSGERDALADAVEAARWECDHMGASDVLLNALARLDALVGGQA